MINLIKIFYENELKSLTPEQQLAIKITIRFVTDKENTKIQTKSIESKFRLDFLADVFGTDFIDKNQYAPKQTHNFIALINAYIFF